MGLFPRVIFAGRKGGRTGYRFRKRPCALSALMQGCRSRSHKSRWQEESRGGAASAGIAEPVRKRSKRLRSTMVAVVIVLLAAGAWSFGVKAVERRHAQARFESDLSLFVHEASILNSYSEGGVTYSQFGEQFAKTSAALDLLRQSYPPSFTYDFAMFQTALDDWSLANRVWSRKFAGVGRTGLRHTGEDLKLLNEVCQADGHPEFPPDENKTTSISNLVSLMLSIASKDFQSARDHSQSLR
jgi:hypothetical protein